MADFNFIVNPSDEAIVIDSEVGRSYLGTPVVSNLVFEKGVYTKNDQEIKFNGLIINTVLITVSHPKNIVKTALQGRDGTVKEYISEGDFIINIQGKLVTEIGNSYPVEQVNDLVEILKVPEALKFTSEFLLNFGGFDLVIENYNIPQVKGVRNEQPFTLSCSSDNPIELQLNAESQL